jgi:hypothetical protein
VTRHQRRFTQLTRPIFPLPVPPRRNGRPSASTPGFTPRRYQRRMPGREQVSRTLTRSYTFDISRPSKRIAHSIPATSCRTALFTPGMTVFAGHRVVRGRRLPSHNGRSLPSRPYSPTRDVGVTRHQQEFPDSRPIPVLPLTCDRHGWNGGPWAFPWASHPTDQEPATHATVGTRSNTDPELRLRHPSNLLHELTHNGEVGLGRGVCVAADPFPQAASRTRRAPQSAPGSPQAP